MEQFYAGILATIAILGGLCTFVYWVFGQFEKNVEHKLDVLCSDVHRLANEVDSERKRKDALYAFVLNNYNKH